MELAIAAGLVILPFIGWLLKKYLYDAESPTESDKIEAEVIEHDHAATNDRLNSNLDKLLGVSHPITRNDIDGLRNQQDKSNNSGAGSNPSETR